MFFGAPFEILYPAFPVTSPQTSFFPAQNSSKFVSPASSIVSALFAHSFAEECEPSPAFSIACALFAQNMGVWGSKQNSDSLTPLFSSACIFPNSKNFRTAAQIRPTSSPCCFAAAATSALQYSSMSTPKPLHLDMPLRLDMNEQIECAFTLASRFYTHPHV